MLRSPSITRSGGATKSADTFGCRSFRQMKWPSKLRPSWLLRHTLVQNTLSLYGVSLPNYLVPILLIPYLARVLGATGWGLVAFAQAFGSYLSVAVEFGFFLSASRDVARNRHDREKLGEILAGVLGARAILCVGCILVAITAGIWVPIFRQQSGLMAASMYWGLVQGFSMSWFFQGLERMKLVAALEIPAQLLGIIGIFVFVHRPEDAWLVLVIQGSAYGLPAVIELMLAYREAPFRLPTFSSMWQAFRMGTSMFVYRGALTLYTGGNALILGFFVPPQFVGYYAAAEKLSRASYRLLNPVTQALFPRMSYLVEHAREKAQQLARVGGIVVGIAGLGLSLAIFLSAPWLIRIIVGPEFAPAVPLLRILAIVPALVAIWQVYGTQWMLPLGMDRAFNSVVLLAGGVNVVLALILVPHYADFGMAWTAVVSEAVIAIGFYLTLRYYKLDPFQPLLEAEEVAR